MVVTFLRPWSKQAESRVQTQERTGSALVWGTLGRRLGNGRPMFSAGMGYTADGWREGVGQRNEGSASQHEDPV